MSVDTEKFCIGVAESNPRQMRLYTNSLRNTKNTLELARDGKKALELLYEDPHMLIIGDGLRGIPTEDVLKRTREFSDIPIIYVGSTDDPDYTEWILGKGADRYLAKGSFSEETFSAYVEAFSRRVKIDQIGKPQSPLISNGDLRIDFARCDVTLGESRLDLPPTQYKLLAHYARNLGKIVPPSQTVAEVWGYELLTNAEASLLRTHINRLRNGLGETANQPRYIAQRIGVGYLMIDHSDQGNKIYER